MAEKAPFAELTRRRFLNAAASGGAGLAAWSLLGDRASAATDRGLRSQSAGRGAAGLTVPLNSGWLFGGTWVAGSSQPGYDDSGFATVTLPHVVTPLSWLEWNPATWEQVWIYRRHFGLPPQMAHMRTFADFQGVLTSVTPTINGTQLSQHQGGYLPFSYELTEYLRSADNVLAMEVDSTWQNVPPEGSSSGPVSIDYLEPGGLYRSAALRFVPQIFLADVFALPTDVLSSSPEVQVQCTVDAAVVPDGSVAVTAELLDGGRLLARESAPVQIGQPGQVTVSLVLSGFGTVRLWDNDHPNLYDVVVTVTVGGHPVHDFSRRIGFREAVFQTDGFYLNGSLLKLFGLNRHQMFPYSGMSMAARVQRHDAEILKKLNCNMVRMSHYPQDPAFLDACDELGIMLWEETPGWGYLGDTAWQQIMLQNVHDMVVRDRSRPSVIIWGVKPNEAPNDPSLYTESKQLADSLDGSRPTSGTTYHSTTDWVFDVMAFDDYSTTSAGASLEPPVAGVPYLVTEAVGTLSGPAVYYRWFDTQDVQQGQATAHARVHNIAGSEDAYCGLLAWCGIDYDSITANTYEDLKWPGVVDVFRVPKPGASFYLAQGDPAVAPVIEPAFYWYFGPTSPVTILGAAATIWSNCDQLEAYVGGEYFAILTPETTDYPYLTHPPFYLDVSAIDGSSLPELRLDGYVGSSLVLSRTFASDPAGDHLELLVDDTELVADGSDTTRVAFRVVDRYGAQRPYPTGDVTVSVDGPAIWLGQVLTFDLAASQFLVQPGQQTEISLTLTNGGFPFEANGGVGGVYIRTLPGQPGEITVRVSHPTLGSAAARITATSAPQAVPGINPRSSQQVNPHEAMTFTNVAMALSVPQGWVATATTGTTSAALPPGASATARWNVTVPSAASAAGSVTATASFVLDQSGQSQSTVVTILPSSVATPLEDAFNNAGISDNSDVASANLDGAGNSFSAEALAAAGLTPGTSFSYDGVTFTWPDVPPGQPDNILAEGQTILVSGSGTKLAFVGASTPSNQPSYETGAGTVYYTDGTTDTYTITLDNYFDPPNTAGNETIAEMPYINCSNPAKNGGVAGQRDHSGWVFYAAVPITSGKTVQAVALPTGGEVNSSSGDVLGMHVFALGIG